MKTTYNLSGITALLATLLIVVLYTPAASQTSAIIDSVPEVIDYNDGPHIFWENDTTAVVFYLCEGTIEKRTFTDSDRLQFNGFCLDSAVSYTIPIGGRAIASDNIPNASKIFIVSDIHGEYEYFVDILVESGVIDTNHNWSWGEGHLVIDGDIFDRGDMVTQCLWLVYNLETQAAENGGGVHFILGNHELMVLQADDRYIHEKYIKGIVKKSRIHHVDLYGPEMELGRWLRSKNTAMIINDILIVHGGLSPAMMERGFTISKLNETVRAKLDLSSSGRAFDSTARMLFGSVGPFWYRGYHYEMEDRYPQITSLGVDSLLDFYNASAIVVGHTGVDQVVGLYENRIFAVDIPFEDLNGLQALLWQEGKFFRVTTDGKTEPID